MADASVANSGQRESNSIDGADRAGRGKSDRGLPKGWHNPSGPASLNLANFLA